MLLSFITCQFTDQSRQNCFPSLQFYVPFLFDFITSPQSLSISATMAPPTRNCRECGESFTTIRYARCAACRRVRAQQSQPSTQLSQPTAQLSQPTAQLSQPTAQPSQPTAQPSRPSRNCADCGQSFAVT